MKNAPQFSVIIPVYKVESYLRECIDSVLAQDYSDYEIILVDDGSPDRCPMICDEYANQHPETIKVIHKANGGLSDARNCGTEHALGKYILYLDSDDYWDDHYLMSALVNAIEHFNLPDIVLFQGKKYFESNGNVIEDTRYDTCVINSSNKDETVAYLIQSQTYSMSACTKAIRREFVRKANVVFEKGLLGEDLDWFFQVMLNIDTIRAIDCSSYVYRIRAGSISASQSIRNEEDQIKIINRWKKAIGAAAIDEENRKYYYSVLAYAYMVALLNYSKLERDDRKKILTALKNEKGILAYAANSKSKITYISTKIIGIRPTSYLLNAYYKKVINGRTKR